jgi:hypothetical protein
MKKMIFVLLSLAMVLAFVGTAYAATTGNNETNSWNPAGPTYSYPGATLGLRGGTAWVPADGSPHDAYTTTSNKCEVCHSPHQAGTSGSSFKLLYGTTSATGASGACLVCHVGSSLSIADVYESGAALGGHDLAAMDHVPDSTWALAGATLGCSDCHTVHGAGAIGTGAYILRSNPTWNGVAYSGAAALNETQFCAACHDQNYPAAINSISHYMGASNAATSTRGATVLASASSADCSSCHSAPVGTGTSNSSEVKWPHQSVSIVGLGLGSSGTAVTDQNHMDDHCLKCHAAVGTTY